MEAQLVVGREAAAASGCQTGNGCVSDLRPSFWISHSALFCFNFPAKFSEEPRNEFILFFLRKAPGAVLIPECSQIKITKTESH